MEPVSYLSAKLLFFSEFSRKAPPNVKLLGRLEHKELEAFYQNAKFLVVPSNWYEVFGMVALEAMSFGLPVIASNFPRALRMQMRSQAKDPFEGLTSEQRQWAPRKMYPNTEAYWRRADNATRGHTMMMGGGQACQRPDQRGEIRARLLKER